jgi:hypothetical protein
MVRSAAARLKPKKGFAHVLHIGITGLIPILVYILVRISFVQLAVLVVVLSKWRIFAVKPRFWPANIRANAIDIIIGLSTIVFMTHTTSNVLQIIFTVLFIVWQVGLKPSRSGLGVSLQALAGQVYGLTALFIGWPDAPTIVFILAGWAVCYLAARHYFTSYDEPYAPLYAHTWGYFAAALLWLSSHWLIFYSVIAQPALLLTAIGFGLGSLYYLHETDRLSVFYRRQITFMMLLVIMIVLIASDWGDKAI